MARRLRAPAKTKPDTAEKSAAEAATPAASGNVTRETKKEWALRVKAKKAEADKAKDDYRKANNLYRAELKAAKGAGVDPADIIWGLETLARDPDEINREIRARNDMALALGIPIGEQLGLFGDGQTVATKVDNAKQAAAERGESQDPEEMGYQAARAGKTIGTNPFDLETQADSFDAFEKGWGRGVAENVTGTPNGVVQAVQH